MDIQANLKEVIAELPTNVRLVAVSKFHPAEAIEAAYSAFGRSTHFWRKQRTRAIRQA